jgi:pimeloyl-ACP methyl ester carboxylesterase
MWKTAEIHGSTIAYRDMGDGYPLLLLHGGGGVGSHWDLLFEQPLPGFRCLLPDLPGHGRSGIATSGISVRRLAADMLHLLDQIGIHRFRGIGMSLGAKTLLQMAADQPGRVDRLVLVSATPYFPAEARALMAQMRPEPDSPEEWEQLRQWHPGGDAQIVALRSHLAAMKDTFDDLNLSPAHLQRIEAPVLLVHGDRDPLYPLSIATRMFRSLPKASLFVVPDGAHVPVFGDAREYFTRLALQFLSPDNP